MADVDESDTDNDGRDRLPFRFNFYPDDMSDLDEGDTEKDARDHNNTVVEADGVEDAFLQRGKEGLGAHCSHPGR